MGRKQIRLASLANLRTFAIAGTLLIANAGPLLAREDHVSFRDFRDLNADMSRREARQMYRAEYQSGRTRDPEPINRIEPVFNGNGTGAFEAVLNNQRSRFSQADQIQQSLTRNRSLQISDEGQLVRTHHGIELDLTSTQRNISLGRNLFSDNQTIQINVGGETKTVGAGSVVSAAEYVAVKQALNGEQKIIVDRSGRASGGEVNLEAIATDRTALRASNLVVAENVTTYGDFGRHSEFKLLGDLNNYGTVLAMSGDGGRRSGSIRAEDINNFSGATIRSENVDLTLNAGGLIFNAGTIESNSSLTLSAGRGVDNKGTVSANADLNLQTPAVVNRGTLASLNGNVNLSGSPDAVLLVNNSKGTIQALNGAINVRDASYSGSFDARVWGGDLLSSELNLNTGASTIDVHVNELTGVLNESGYAAHVSASTDTLTIGTICLTGDPTVFNDSGTLHISGNIDVAEDLVLLSAGDITSADNISIRARSSLTGYNIELIAGADFKVIGGGGVGSDEGIGTIAAIDVPPLFPTGDVELSGKKSKTGGGVLLGNNVLISTRAIDTSGNSDGDVVGILAFAGKNAGAGTIDLSGTTIETGGSGTGKNGSVYILADGTKGDVIKTGIINTTGGTNASFGDANQNGVVGIYTVNIVSSIKGQPVTYNEFGQRTSAAFLTGEDLSKSGNLIVTDTAAATDILASGFIDINGGGSVQLLGQVEAAVGASNAGSAEMVSNGSITDGPNGSLTSSTVIFMIAPNIGTPTNPVTVNAPDVESFGGKGSNNYVEILGTGNVEVAGTSKGTTSFFAPGRTVRTLDFVFIGPAINTDKLIIEAESIGLLRDLSAGDVTIKTSSGNIQNSNFNGPLQIRTLTLETADGNIGSSGTALTLGNGLNTVSAKSETGDIFLQGTEGSLNITTLETGAGAIGVTSTDSVTLPATVNAGGGTFSLVISQGTITANGVVSARDGITLSNTNGNGKISIGKDAQLITAATVDGLGNVLVSLGPDVATVAPLPANVTTDIQGTGTVVFTGSGAKAKSPNNVMHIVGGADILFNNGGKNGNLTLGGNVNVTASEVIPGP